MPTLTIATHSKAVSSLALLMSTTQTLSETKKNLTQRVDALKAELQALLVIHAPTIASLQAEQKACDLLITDQQAKNDALQMKNNKLRGQVAIYRTALATHQCSLNKLNRGILNAVRVQYLQETKPIEKFLELLKPPVVIGDPMGIAAYDAVNPKLSSSKCCSIC